MNELVLKLQDTIGVAASMLGLFGINLVRDGLEVQMACLSPYPCLTQHDSAREDSSYAWTRQFAAFLDWILGIYKKMSEDHVVTVA